MSGSIFGQFGAKFWANDLCLYEGIWKWLKLDKVKCV